MKKLKSIFVNGIVKDSKNNMEKYLFNENERLNVKIDKAIEYIKENTKNDTFCEWYDGEVKDLLEILGDKE